MYSTAVWFRTLYRAVRPNLSLGKVFYYLLTTFGNFASNKQAKQSVELRALS